MIERISGIARPRDHDRNEFYVNGRLRRSGAPERPIIDNSPSVLDIHDRLLHSEGIR